MASSRPLWLPLVAATSLVLVSAGIPDAANAASVVVVTVPTGFSPTLSDTRDGGHYQLDGSALRVWTDGSTSSDKVAEYWAVELALSAAGEPSLDYVDVSGGGARPGVQLGVDFDADGAVDGILVGETIYGNDWWLSHSAAEFVKESAPLTSGGSGSPHHGTLDQWRAAFPGAHVRYLGFALGSGVHGSGTLNAVNLGEVTYVFGLETAAPEIGEDASLAATGAAFSSWWLVGAAIVALLGGGVAVFLARRRSAARD